MTDRAGWIEQQLDEARLRPIHVRALALCTIVMMIDGYDLYLVGWILPKLSDAFHVSRLALTPVLLIQQVGMLLGGYLIAPLADRVGRRNLLAICLAGIGATSLLTALATTPTAFTCGRIATGLFAAAIVPNLLALAAEVAPLRLRATFTTVTICGAMGGSLIGAAMQAFVLVPYGWVGAVVLGGLLPLLVLPLVLLLLPESLRFIARRNAADPRIARMLPAYGITGDPVAPAGTTPSAAASAPAGSIATLLSPSRRGFTVLLWLVFIASFSFIGQWGAWSTTVFHDVLHMDWPDVARVTTIYTLMGVVGTLGVGILIDRWGFRAVLPTVFGIGFVGAIGIGVTAGGGMMYVALAIMSLFQVASQAGLAALAPTLYPSMMRATGVGAAYGAGRIGSMAGPAIGSALLASGAGVVAIFTGFGLPLLIAALLLLLLLATPDRAERAAQAVPA